jgi:hypothetical protein
MWDDKEKYWRFRMSKRQEVYKNGRHSYTVGDGYVFIEDPQNSLKAINVFFDNHPLPPNLRSAEKSRSTRRYEQNNR